MTLFFGIIPNVDSLMFYQLSQKPKVPRLGTQQKLDMSLHGRPNLAHIMDLRRRSKQRRADLRSR